MNSKSSGAANDTLSLQDQMLDQLFQKADADVLNQSALASILKTQS